MEFDDDNSCSSGHSDTGSPYNLQRRSASGDEEVTGGRTTGKRVKKNDEDQPIYTRLPTDTRTISGLLSHLKPKLKSQPYDSIASNRIVHAALTLQLEYCRELVKKGGVKPPAPKIRHKVCQMFAISPITYSKIMNAFLEKDAQPYKTGARGGGETESRIPQTKRTVISIRAFIREQRAKKMRTTAVQVLEHCQQEGFIDQLDPDDADYKKKYAAEIRATQRWLRKNHYKRGKRSGNVVLKEHIALKRDQYLTTFFTNRSTPQESRLREVYLDESYIHQHYKKDVDSLYDPNDKQDLQIGKDKNKGNRYLFLCAIQGPNPRVFEPSTDIENGRLLDKLNLAQVTLQSDRGGVVPGTVWAFCPQQKKLHKGDYHKVFNSNNFLQWWQDQLLPNLHQPSLIIMDNAKYHCTYPDDVPKGAKKKKIDFINYCQSRNIPINPTDTIPMIKEKMKEKMKQEKMVCELLAEERGHKVLFTPPCHSDFQPIELLWAKLKGNIGQKYDSNTTMAVLKQRLDEEFEASYGWNESIEGMIHKSTAIAKSFYQTILQEEDDPDDAPSRIDSDSDGSESDEESDAVVAL